MDDVVAETGRSEPAQTSKREKRGRSRNLQRGEAGTSRVENVEEGVITRRCRIK